MKLKGFGANISLLLGSTLFCILIAETFFYFLDRPSQAYPVVFYKTEDPSITLWCYDDHFAGIPDWDLRQDHPFETLTYAGNTDDDPALEELLPQHVPNAIEVRNNEFNFRARPFAQLEQEGLQSTVALLIGDSFCFGQGVRLEERFSNILEKKLNTSRQDSTEQKHLLINLCAAGMNIRRISQVMQQSVEHFDQAQRVIYSFTLNDPVMSREVFEMQKYINDFMHFRQTRFSSNFHSMLARLPSPTIRWVTERIVKNQVSRDTIEWYRQMYRDNAGWRQTQKVLLEMHRFCAARGVELTLVVFPLYYRLKDYPLEEVHRTLAQFAGQNGIHYIDLLEIFAGANEMDYWVHPRDFHPNTRAPREVAEFLYSAIPW